MAEYEAKFLQFSRYAQGMVAIEKDKFVPFKNGLRYELMIQVTPIRFRNVSGKNQDCRRGKTFGV